MERFNKPSITILLLLLLTSSALILIGCENIQSLEKLSKSYITSKAIVFKNLSQFSPSDQEIILSIDSLVEQLQFAKNGQYSLTEKVEIAKESYQKVKDVVDRNRHLFTNEEFETLQSMNQAIKNNDEIRIVLLTTQLIDVYKN